MALNGIDISRYQKDIDLSKVPCDFAIVKATEGADYVSPEYDAQYKAAKKAGKKIGVYHFASGNHTGEKEADYFLSQVKDVIGEAILCLDWESDALKKGVSYAKAFLDRVYEKTGVKPFIYMSKSVCRDYDWSSVVNAGYPLWCAQYANSNITGYQDNPWTDSKGMGAFKKMVIHQYSSHGRLDGYSGNLDIDIFYGTESDWDKYAGKSESSSKPVEKPTSTGKTVNYKVKINTASGVNVRKGPGESYGKITAIANGKTVTITKEQSGWGYVKEYKGWICLKYTKKVTATTSSTKKDNDIAELQRECNKQGYSNQKIDGIPGPNTLAGCPTVKKGAKGNITKWIQKRLISLGYSCGSSGADGDFGSGTEKAVKNFQKANGLTADGIVGKDTWKELLGL